MTSTEKEIEAAKAYLRLRLDAELSMVYNLEVIMREAAERFVEICYSANVDPNNSSFDKLPIKVRMQLEEVIQWLRETIEDYFLTLAIAEHEENKDKILPFILGAENGFIFSERLEDYCTKYRDELLLLIGAGLFLDIGKSALAKSIGSHLKQPYKNPDLVDGIAAPITYGRGRTNSMLTAIGNLTRFGIAHGWMKNWEIETTKDGAIGWMVQRGSTVPCSLCDENCGFHTIEEGTQLPQHVCCCCLAIPIYDNHSLNFL